MPLLTNCDYQLIVVFMDRDIKSPEKSPTFLDRINEFSYAGIFFLASYAVILSFVSYRSDLESIYPCWHLFLGFLRCY